ncbi:hypothetical protein NMY22_g8038 [Coprinellus aureogranulatus]|nr:hypothetical protein NMY22_g8038 [Coprinellus aureogranulatus]
MNSFTFSNCFEYLPTSFNSRACLCGSTLTAIVLGCRVYQRLTEISLRDVRGPEATHEMSWLAGDIITLFTDTTGMLGARWAAMYGTVVRLRAQLFSKNALLIADPAALHHILQSEHADKFVRAPEWNVLADFLAGDCMGSSDGDRHRRHRKGMQPAFGALETRELLPVFNGVANKLCDKWDELIEADSKRKPVINVAEWIGKAAVDAFGEAALDYTFGALDDEPTELARVLPTVLVETFGAPTGSQLAAPSALQYVPKRAIQWVLNEAPIGGKLPHIRNTNAASRQIMLRLIEERRDMMKIGGDGRKDILSHILRAGLSDDPVTKLVDHEIVSELRFLLLAGQETSANTLTWSLNELVKAPRLQSALRQEIRDARQKKGGKDLTAQDFQSLPLLNAVIKETLRFCPVIQTIFRQSSEDDVLPLFEPLKLKNGKAVNALPIPRGAKLYLSLAGYNMIPSVWGPDANTFNPYRWLDYRLGGEGSISMGMYANLLTFSAGSKGCIGWRFAILELQCFLVALVERFEFSAASSTSKVVRGEPFYHPISDGGGLTPA